MKNKIKIGKPYIKEGKSDILGESVKLCAEVTMKNPNTNEIETKECYFEFEKGYKNYLCPERSDAFVMGLLSSAMELDMDIEYENPISEQLYYQLITYYIPLVSKYNANYPMHNIKLIGPHDSKPIKNEGAVATGCSGGVDSFYTIARHSKGKVDNNYQLTHLVYSSSGTMDMIEDRIKNTYKETFLQIKQIAKECSLDVIGCYNNLNKFYLFPYKAFNMFYTTTFCAVSFCLQKLIHIYYASSGSPISVFNLNLEEVPYGHDASVFDVFTLSCINTENLQFYSTGIECGRIEKELYIADFRPAQKYLNVCVVKSFYKNQKNNYNNCSICEKCLRTMTHLFAIGGGTLQKFNGTFDVDQFLEHKAKWIGKMMGLSKKSYVKDMKAEAKKNKIKIPLASYFYAYFWYKPIKFLRKTFKNSLLARKIYYKLNLDYKLDGYRGPTYEAYKDKSIH